ncbi:MAG: cyclic nucleotide-binding domain-containing protein [Hyphomicrobiales bacterium]|nr:cyclic nucleotide-binding domain-containing protein [Hyphomicrobiales bacterium]
MATLVQEVDILRKIPLFSGIDPVKLKLLAFASERVEYDTGQNLFRQGEVGDAAYVIVHGVADIIVETKDGEIPVAEFKDNAFVGEIAILCDVPRTATVRAKTKLVVLKIKKEHFLGLINDFPELGIEVMRELASRLSNTTNELSETRRELEQSKSK